MSDHEVLHSNGPVPPTVRDEDWFARLRNELQARGVPGRRAGEVVAEAEEHLRDSGERAGDAFGDPVAYAAALFPHSHLARAVLRTILPTLAGYGAFVACCWLPLALSGSATGRWGHLLALLPWLVVVVPMGGMWSRVTSQGRRLLTMFVLFLVATGCADWLRDTPLGQRTFTMGAGVGWLLAVAGNVWVVLAVRWGVRNRIIDPRTGEDRFSSPRWLQVALPWLFPAACAFVLVLRALSR